LAGRKLHEEAEEFGASQALALRKSASATASSKTFFAKSTATIVAFISDSFWLGLSLKHHTCSAWHIDAVLPF
jgi:hypothetical protein